MKYIKTILFLIVVCGFLGVNPGAVEVYPGKYVVLKNAFFPGGMEKDITIPIDENGRVILNYPGPWEDSFRFINPEWIGNEQNEKYKSYLNSLVRNFIVLITDVSTAGKDYTSSVFEPVYPSSGVLASLIQSVLKENFLSSYSLPETFFLYFILAGGIWFGALHLKPGHFIYVGIIALLLLSGWNFISFLVLNKLPPMIVPIAGSFISLTSTLVYKLFLEDKKTALSIICKQDQKIEVLKKPENNGKSEIFEIRCREFSITKRQQEIIRLTFENYASKEIAYKLVLRQISFKLICPTQKRSDYAGQHIYFTFPIIFKETIIMD